MLFKKITIFLATMCFFLLCANAIKNLIDEKSYSASTEALIRLLDIEEMLVENLELYLEALKLKLNIVQKALENFRAEESRMLADYETYLGNPLNSFSLIRHQQEEWTKWALFMESMVGIEQIEYANRLRSELPTALDLQDASRSIELLIAYYELLPTELAAGTLLGHSQPDAALSALDCYAMGKFNFFQKDYSRAKHWLNTSLEKYNTRNTYEVYDFDENILNKWFGKALVKCKEFDAGMQHLAIVQATNYLGYYETLLVNNKHCSANFTRPSNLHCRYNNLTTPFLRIAPLKMEELNVDPLTVLYHDAIYESEIAWLLNKTLDFQPALLVNEQLSPDRTAQDVKFEDDEDEVTKAIIKRITDMTGFGMKTADLLSLINYGVGGHYDLHFDANDEPRGERGNRIATVLFYLGNVDLGGSTILPELNLTITPMKGNALLWHNLTPNGKVHLKSLHAACPVIVGSKYVMTKWIYDREQMFIKPCQANHTIDTGSRQLVAFK